MGNNQAKDVFVQLDKEGTGLLTLDKIMLLKDLPGVRNNALCSSLPILFHFDESHQGAITLKEFVDLVKHVQASEKKVHKKVKKAPNFFQEFLNKKIKGRPDHEPTEKKRQAVRSSTNLSTMKVDRSGSTPMFISYNAKTSAESSSDETDSHCSDDESAGTDDEEEKADAGNIVRKFLQSLTNQLRGRDGRERYMNWLFRLADTHRAQCISMDDLEVFLEAVARDGINLEEILYDQGECAGPIAARIMNEYNTEHNGLLSKEEFMVLADLIVKEYELCETRDMECIGKYQLLRTLGKGSYGVVRCCVSKDTAERKAMKIIKRGSVSDMSRLDVEIKAMMMLRHPNVVRLEEVLETEDNVCLLMELCGGGSLYEQSMLTPDHPFDEDLARFYFTQLIDGLAYCHQSGVVHRDLRLENLLLDNQGHLKITDFGHAGIFKQGWDIFSTSLVGSLYHLSPEQICGKCYSGEKMDIWSAGVLLYCMLHGQPPFFTENVVELLDCIKTGRYEQVQQVSEEARDLIDKMLQVDPSKRITTSEIKKHIWMHGPCKEPVLVRYEIPLDPVWTEHPAVPKRVIADVVKERDIHCHGTHPPSERALWAMHCYCPAENLKFSIAFMNFQDEEPWPYVEFRLKEGESLLFRKLCRRFQALCQKRLQEDAEKLKRDSQTMSRSPSAPNLEVRKPVAQNGTVGKQEAEALSVGLSVRAQSMGVISQAPSTDLSSAREIRLPREPQSPRLHRTSRSERPSECALSDNAQGVDASSLRTLPSIVVDRDSEPQTGQHVTDTTLGGSGSNPHVASSFGHVSDPKLPEAPTPIRDPTFSEPGKANAT